MLAEFLPQALMDVCVLPACLVAPGGCWRSCHCVACSTSSLSPASHQDLFCSVSCCLLPIAGSHALPNPGCSHLEVFTSTCTDPLPRSGRIPGVGALPFVDRHPCRDGILEESAGAVMAAEHSEEDQGRWVRGGCSPSRRLSMGLTQEAVNGGHKGGCSKGLQGGVTGPGQRLSDGALWFPETRAGLVGVNRK